MRGGASGISKLFQQAAGIAQSGCYDAATQAEARKYVGNAPGSTCSC